MKSVIAFPELLLFFLSLVMLIAFTNQSFAAKKCPPGSYWDERDQMCIYSNGN